MSDILGIGGLGTTGLTGLTDINKIKNATGTSAEDQARVNALIDALKKAENVDSTKEGSTVEGLKKNNEFQNQLMMSLIQSMFQDSPAYPMVMGSLASAISKNQDGNSKYMNIPDQYTKAKGTGYVMPKDSLYEGLDPKIASAIDKACKNNNIDPAFIMAVIKQESNFNPNAVSSAGATGIMQIMPFNFESLGIKNPYDAEQNIEGGTSMLSGLLKKYGDKKIALAAYNAGSGTVARRGINGEADFHKLPYETQDYIKKVTAYEESYKNMNRY